MILEFLVVFGLNILQCAHFKKKYAIIENLGFLGGIGFGLRQRIALLELSDVIKFETDFIF